MSDFVPASICISMLSRKTARHKQLPTVYGGLSKYPTGIWVIPLYCGA